MTHGHRTVPDDVPLGQTLARVLLRRWYAVLLPLLVLPAGAFYLSVRQQPTYEAGAKILVSRPELAAILLEVPLPAVNPLRGIDTERDLAGLRAVAARAARELRLPPDSVGAMAKTIRVDGSRLSDVLTVSARSPSAARSVRVANAAAVAYTEIRRRLEVRDLERARVRSEADLRAAAPGSDKARELRDRLDRLETLEDLATSGAVVVERAVSAERVAPQPLRTAQFGVATAVLIGIALAYLADAFDRRVRSVAELGSILGFPVVGELPGVRRPLRVRRRLLTPVRDAPLCLAAEAFRFLETNVALSPVGSACRAVLVTSAGRREGKSTVAFNFALSAAEAGKRVLLVELDFRHPRLRETTDALGASGMAEIVRGTARLSDVAIELEVPPEPGAASGASGLTVVLAGTEVSNPMQYLRAAATAAFLRDARDHFDLVVVDVPPLFGVADAMVASSLVDGVLLVVDYRRARRPRLAELLDVTRQLPAPLIGVVVNHAPRRPPAPPQAFGRDVDEPARIARAA